MLEKCGRRVVCHVPAVMVAHLKRVEKFSLIAGFLSGMHVFQGHQRISIASVLHYAVYIACNADRQRSAALCTLFASRNTRVAATFTAFCPSHLSPTSTANSSL